MKNRNAMAALLATACIFAASLARAELVVIVSAKSSTSSLSPAQVSNVFLGKDTSMQPFDLPESSPARDAFYKKVAGKDAAQVKAIWSRIVFTGTAQPPKELASSAEIAKAVASNDKAIGYVEKSAVTPGVKVVLTVH